MDCEIIIVSGLPRSGTSLMMQMLESGGVEVVTDNIRTADVDNPRGYYELEKVKNDQAGRVLAARDAGQGLQDGLAAPLRPASEREIPDHLHGTGPGRDAAFAGEDARAIGPDRGASRAR